MRIPDGIPIFGDIEFRGECKLEEFEQQDFVAWLRLEYPNYARLMIHPKNEGVRDGKLSSKDKRNGCLNTGASDIIIPASPSFVCEMKRANHTKSSASYDQVVYLRASIRLGAFGCIALGCEGAKKAFISWITENNHCV
jgi:hypothetical protein